MRKLTFSEKGIRPVLNDEERKALEFSLNKRFENQLNHSRSARSSGTLERFTIDASFNSEQVQLRITLGSIDGSQGYPVETVICPEEHESFLKMPEPAKKELAILVEFQESYWTEYFQSGRETFVTLDWSENQFAGHQIFVRGFERNFALENAADALFAEHGMGGHDIEPISAET